MEKLDKTTWATTDLSEKSGSMLIFGTEQYNYCFLVSRTDTDDDTFKAGIFVYDNPNVSMTLIEPGEQPTLRAVAGVLSQDGKKLTLSDGPSFIYAPDLDFNRSDRKEIKNTYWECDDSNTLSIDKNGIIDFVENGELYAGGSFYINPFAGLVVDYPGRVTGFRAGRVSRDGNTLKLSNGKTYRFTPVQ